MKLADYISFTKTDIILLACALVFSLTPFYGIGYILIIFYITRLSYITWLSDSYIARFALSFLLLCVSIMLAATLSWLAHIQVIPLVVLLIVLGIHLLLSRYQDIRPINKHDIHLFTRDDLVSLALALLAPLIVFASFFIPNFSPSASIQLLTRGYDNIAHLTFMRAVSDEKGYVYGPEAEIEKKTIHGGGEYPQGWHIASSNIVDGFAIRFFQSENPILAVNTYLVISCFWYILTVYLFSKFSLALIRGKLRKFRTFDHYGVFALSNILIQLMLFWGCIALGFSNFLACIAYILVLAAIFHDESMRPIVRLGLSLLVLIAVSQVWLLPLPAIVAAMIIYFIDKGLLDTVRSSSVRQRVSVVVMLALGIAFSVFQVYIFLRFGRLSANEAINHDGGVFWISQILFGLMMIGSLLYWLYTKSSIITLRALLSLSTAFMGMLVVLFAYQIFTNEKTTYYFVKFLGLGLGVVGIYFVSAFTVYMSSRDTWKRLTGFILPTSFATVSILGVAIVSTGQTTTAFNSLFQRYSIISTPVSTAIVNYINSNDYRAGNQIVILGGKSYAEDNVGTYIANRLQHKPGLCANNVNTLEEPVKDRTKNLLACADQEGKPIIVVTSHLTNEYIKSLHRNDLIITQTSD